MARRGSTEGLRLWHFLLNSGILSASSASASAATATTATATASTHLERNELRARPDHSRHKIPIHKQARKRVKKRTMTWIINGSPSLDQQSQWQAITITTLIFTTSMLLVVSLRFWIRRRILHREDWLTFGTMLFSIIYSASVILQTRYGLGLPVVLQPVQDWRKYMMINYASRPFYLLGL